MTTSRLVEQRIRNRLFEYVEWVVDAEHAPPELGLNELLNQWEDFVRRPVEVETFPAPVFTEPEVEALKTLDSAWNRFCNATPATVLDERAAMSAPEWRDFVGAAKATAQVSSEDDCRRTSILLRAARQGRMFQIGQQPTYVDYC